jgi:hypothetical protein
MKNILRILGPILLLLGSSLILSIVVSYLFLCYSAYPQLDREIPSVIEMEELQRIRIGKDYRGTITADVVFCLFNALNIFFNYFYCATTKPGSPPVCADPEIYLGQKTIGQINGRKVYGSVPRLDLAPGVSYRYCSKCRAIKPPRCKPIRLARVGSQDVTTGILSFISLFIGHHCSVLSRCVYHHDHFCPWMNNSIGFYNYRYFVLFLLYIFIGSIHICVSLYFQRL